MVKSKETEQKKSKTVMLTDSEDKKIEELAKKLEISKTLLMRNLLLIGLNDIDVLNKAGLLSVCMRGEKLYKKIRNKIIKSGEESISVDDFKDEEEMESIENDNTEESKN